MRQAPLLMITRNYSEERLPTLTLFTKKYVGIKRLLAQSGTTDNTMFTQSPCSLCDDAKEVLKKYKNEVYRYIQPYVHAPYSPTYSSYTEKSTLMLLRMKSGSDSTSTMFLSCI